jgi:hypothetical protein
MPRPYHSPSSIELADKCRKAWGLRYISGLRYNDAPWQPLPAYTEAFVWPDWVDLKVIRADTEKDRSGRTLAERLIGRQHSSAFGTAMHSIGEGWFRGEDVDWQSDPGKVFLSGAHLLPHPSRCHEVRIEEPIGTVPYTSKHLGETRLLEVGGIRLMGYIDLEVLPFEEESARLGIPPGWAVIDYKSTKDLKYPVYDFKGSDDQRWAQKAEALKHDTQAALYAYAHAHSDRSIWHGMDPVQLAFAPDPCPPQRWVYFQTQGRPAARAVDVHTSYRDALARVHLMVEQAKVLDSLESIDQCIPNPSACPEYGGCEFHVSKGGPCTAERRLGAAVNQVVKLQQKRDTPMTITAPTPAQTRFQQLAQQRRAGQAPAPAAAPPAAEAPPPAPAAPQPAPAASTNSFGAPVAPAVAAAPRRGRPAAARPPVAAPPPPPPAPVEEEHSAGAAPVYRFTIECSDPAELAAIVEIVNQALAQ